ncbi:MAG: hypothetical protein KDE15_15025 [Erythrobacter sp.]|nr:hypothetical protein [Erythrobacter sp.]
MSMTKPVAQMRITNDLREAEAAIDNALLQQAKLLSTMVLARRETGSSPTMGHEAMLRLVKSQQTILTASGELARVHGSLLKIQSDVLGYEDCPSEGAPTQPFIPAGIIAA